MLLPVHPLVHPPVPRMFAHLQLELFNLYHQGELHKLVAVAKQTEMTFDMVSSVAGSAAGMLTVR